MTFGLRTVVRCALVGGLLLKGAILGRVLVAFVRRNSDD